MNNSSRLMVTAAFAAAVFAQAAYADTFSQATNDYAEGQRYFTGYDVLRDYKRAAEYYRQAADKGHHLAQYNLGLMHEHGYGVAVNPVEAAHWYTMAAQGGHPHASQRISMLGLPAPSVNAPAATYAMTPAPAYSVPETVSAPPAPVAAPVPANVVTYQNALIRNDYGAALGALAQARAQQELGVAGLSEAQAAQELGRLALLGNNRALAENYLQQALAAGSPQAQAALAQLTNSTATGDAGATAALAEALRSGSPMALLHRNKADSAEVATAKALAGQALLQSGVAANLANNGLMNGLPQGTGALAAAALSGDTAAVQQAALDAVTQKAKEEASKALANAIPVPGVGALFGLFGSKKTEK